MSGNKNSGRKASAFEHLMAMVYHRRCRVGGKYEYTRVGVKFYRETCRQLGLEKGYRVDVIPVAPDKFKLGYFTGHVLTNASACLKAEYKELHRVSPGMYAYGNGVFTKVSS